MSINLRKNEKVKLSKTSNSLANVVVAMGWDVNRHKGRPMQSENSGERKGLFSRLFGGGSSTASGSVYSDYDYDLDASIKICYTNSNKDEIVCYSRLLDRTRCIQHGGDNLTGAGDGDDESILVQLNKLPSDVTRLVIGANIYQAYQRKQDFGQVENAFLRMYNKDNGVEMLKYNLTDEFANMTAVIFGELNRIGDDWEFKAVGEGYKVRDIDEMFKNV